MNSPKDILEKLETLDFDALIGLMESEWLDAKETPYHLDSPKQKLELAKDVTAFANAGGGIIVIGFDCEKLATMAGERICKVCQFPVTLIDKNKYNQILADIVHPAPHGVSVLVYEAQDGRGVAAILVDASMMTEKPYLVGKMLDENDLAIGSYFGFFERKRDFTPSISIARIQHQLAAGLQWNSIHERLSSIEGKIDSWTTPPPNPSTKIIGIAKPEREARLKQARLAMGRDDSPIVYFMATTEGPCDFPTLFKSHAERVVRLIENPPQLRNNGFELWADRTSEIVEGRFRRNMIAGHRLIELWKDGHFIFIAPGDEDFLGWSVGSSDGKPIHISNFVLAESTLVFCWLAKWIFAEANPKPPVIRLAVGFDNLSRPAGNATLGTAPEGRMRGFNKPKAARGPACEVYELADWDDYDPERLAYKLVENIYHWFSFESDGIPYVDSTGPEPKLSAVTLVEKPLPTAPPATPGYA
jgi:hypothetical protein